MGEREQSASSEKGRTDEGRDLLDALLELLLLSGDSVASNGLDSFRLEDGLEVVRVLVLKADVALFGLEHAGEVDLTRNRRSASSRASEGKRRVSAHLLELELHWLGIASSHGVRNLVPEEEGFLSASTGHVDEQGVGVAVDDLQNGWRVSDLRDEGTEDGRLALARH